MARRLRKTVNLYVTVIQIVENLRRSWLLSRDGAGDFMPAFAPYPGELEDFEFQLDVNPWRDTHTDQEIWDAFVDPLGVLNIARYDEPEGVRAIWAFNAHLLGTGLAAVIWGSEWAAYRILMMPVALIHVAPAVGLYMLAGAYSGTSHIHGGVSPHSQGMGMPPQVGSGGTRDNPAGWNLSQWWANLF